MKLTDKVLVVTGGANGIGRALCMRFAREGPRAIVVADVDEERARRVALDVGGISMTVNVGIEADIVALVERTSAEYGQVDLLVSNAGLFTSGGVETPNGDWQRMWDVNLMAHVYAARAVLPQMLARGDGYLLQTASAAGLLSQIDSASYSATKHAAVAFAEWLSITHGDQGIKVSCLCPQGVRTKMLLGGSSDDKSFLMDGSVSAEEVAEVVVKGIEEEQFLILPHPEVMEYFSRKASDYDRWIRGMRRLQKKVRGQS
jgi:NAD(P)-dependent dehydrogenase (short-subunit alcohol dehydrogenase family)